MTGVQTCALPIFFNIIEAFIRVTVLVDERADGVHISYDRMASLLASYGNGDALQVARDLDVKVEHLLQQAAA